MVQLATTVPQTVCGFEQKHQHNNKTACYVNGSKTHIHGKLFQRQEFHKDESNSIVLRLNN